MEILTAELCITLQGEGPLPAWLGPAIRGLVNGRFKRAVCVHPVQEQLERWAYCRGCSHQATCTYAQTFEPLPPAGSGVEGDREAVRPFVIAPSFPSPERATVGLRIWSRLIAIGQAIEQVPTALQQLASAGWEQRKPENYQWTRLGPDAIPFMLDPLSAKSIHSIDSDYWPGSEDDFPGVLPRLEVCLTGPLMLRQRRSDQPVTSPNLADLFWASFRTTRRMHALCGKQLDINPQPIMELAESVIMTDDYFDSFTQTHWSNRQQQGNLIRGTIGSGVFANVPMCLIPWLIWGGRLGVGSYRMSGAGMWRLILD